MTDFIVYIDLSDFRRQKISGIMEMEMCYEILIFQIFVPWRPFTQHASHIF